MALTEQQRERYARHITLEGVGEEGQERLINGRVLIIGAGGLGSPAAMYLAAAGVGTIGIADADVVDLTNLQRQIIHSNNDIGRKKVISAKETIEGINPEVRVRAYHTFVDADNIADMIAEYDFIIDATDNFESKFLINDACVLNKKPFCHGGILGFDGQIMTYVPDKGPCYRCVFRDMPPKEDVLTCKEVGIIGAMPGTIGTLQAMEAIKYLLGVGELLVGCLLTYNALTMDFRKIKLPPMVKDCPVCGEMPTITKLNDCK